MDKNRIRNWIEGWIEVAHELMGADKKIKSCSIALPIDIVAALLKSGVIMECEGCYTFLTNICRVYVEAVAARDWSATMSLKITKAE